MSAASHRAGVREAQALHQQRLRLADTSFRVLVAGTAALILLAFVATAFFLVREAWPALSHYGRLSFLESIALGAVRGGIAHRRHESRTASSSSSTAPC